MYKTTIDNGIRSWGVGRILELLAAAAEVSKNIRVGVQMFLYLYKLFV
ncbi:hypothetical protein [Anabaena sp. CCY 0017]